MVGAAIAAGAGLVSTLAAQESAKKARDLINSIQAPTVADREIILEQYIQQGLITPEELQAYQQEESELANISTDPALQLAQQEALNSLMDISKDGLTATDKSRLQAIQSEEQATSRGAREALMSNAQARGMGGSGLELMALLKNQQDSATRQSSRDLGVEALAQERALEALIQGGSLAGNMQNQSFNQQAQQANAQDAINKFNTTNMQSVSNQNTQNRNTAQTANLNAGQTLANANTDLRNQQQTYNKELLQSDFNNQMTKAGQQVAGETANTNFLNNLGGTLFQTAGNMWAAEDDDKDK